MSGSFETIDVPPTLVSFAVTHDTVDRVITPEFKGAEHKVVLVKTDYNENNLPDTKSLLSNFELINSLIEKGEVLSCYTPTYGGIAEAILKMSMGNDIGFNFDGISNEMIFGYNYGSFIIELKNDIDIGIVLGKTTDRKSISNNGVLVSLEKLKDIYENKLESVFNCNIKQDNIKTENFSYKTEKRVAPSIKCAVPRVLIPVFPGTNCEFDTAKVLRDAGAEPEIIVINNLSSNGISQSVEYFANELKKSQIVFIPGGFSGGDEPDGSGKFITAFFRNAAIK